MTDNPAAAITGWHAHVYYDPERPETRTTAAVVRAAVEAKFDVAMGRWRDEPVGPHAMPMFQIAFTPELFAEFVPWLALNHAGLSVLIHPESGSESEIVMADHSEHALWLGTQLAVDLEFLRHFNSA